MRILIIAVTAMGVGGCASVVRGTDEQVSFVSDPSDAHLQLSNGLSCTSTPCTLKVARKDDFTATFTKDGFQPESVLVTSHVSGNGAAVGAGNILVGGVVGVGVDAYNGANLDHEPNPLIVHLAPFAPIAKPGAKKNRHDPVS